MESTLETGRPTAAAGRPIHLGDSRPGSWSVAACLPVQTLQRPSRRGRGGGRAQCSSFGAPLGPGLPRIGHARVRVTLLPYHQHLQRCRQLLASGPALGPLNQSHPPLPPRGPPPGDGQIPAFPARHRGSDPVTLLPQPFLLGAAAVRIRAVHTCAVNGVEETDDHLPGALLALHAGRKSRKTAPRYGPPFAITHYVKNQIATEHREYCPISRR